jgi:hypothetical protein
MKIDKLSTHDDFKKLCYENESNKHFTPKFYEIRWNYHSIVLDMLKNDIDNIDTILEVGNSGFYFSKNSIAIVDSTDQKNRDDDIVSDIRQDYKGDFRDQLARGELGIRQPRWPFEDKQFDMFIALEVWEHLWNVNSTGDCGHEWNPTERKKKYGVEHPIVQASVFKEVMRVSKNAILSFPYMWGEHNGCPTNNCHYQIDREIIKEWTCGVEPIEITDLQHNTTNHTVYRWRF